MPFEEDQTNHKGSSPLFAIFVLSLMVLFLVPTTLYKCCSDTDDEQTLKAWEKEEKKKKGVGKKVMGFFTRGNTILLVLWGVVAVLLVYIESSQKEFAPFDPFAIMNLEPTATEKDIKKKYRNLAKEFHPDKNPDPKAAEYFDELVKAYKALTDDVARENWIKHGHPDGPQAMNIGVAMPSFLFNADKNTAPLMLLGLVFFGILLPLGAAACYLTRSNKYAGPNQVQHETLGLWFSHPKFGIKESQGLRRIPDTLVVAKEFIDMPVPAEQGPALEELKRIASRFHPELKDTKKDFWKRKSSIIKVHLLLLTFLERAEDEIPEILKQDLTMILQRLPPLLSELMNVAVYPRKQYLLYGWMCPAVAVVEMMQCLTQVVPIRVRKPASTGSGKGDKGGEAGAAFLQLPHMDQDVMKKLSRKKIRSLAEVAAMPSKERTDALTGAGFTAEQAADVETFFLAMPTVHAEVSFHVDGHESVMEGDMVTALVYVGLTRASHAANGVSVNVGKAKAVEAYSPHFPEPRKEQWYFLLCDVGRNLLLSHGRETLLAAEQIGADEPERFIGSEASKAVALAIKSNKTEVKTKECMSAEPEDEDDIDDEDEEDGEGEGLLGNGSADGAKEDGRQQVQLKFIAPPAGRYSLQLNIMSDCWIGCDKIITVPLVVEKLNRAEKEAREAKYMATKPFDDSDEEDDDDDDEDGAADEDYDSEETGTDVSDDEDDNGSSKDAGNDESTDDEMPELVEQI